MVRQTLGEDAVIVATREERDGKGVRVTAAVEQPDNAEFNEFEREFERDFMELAHAARPVGRIHEGGSRPASRIHEGAPRPAGRAPDSRPLEARAQDRSTTERGHHDSRAFSFAINDGEPHFEIDTVRTPQTSPREWLQYDSEDEEGAVIEQLTDVMLRHGVPDEITDQIISCATVIGADDAETALTAAFEHLYSFRPLTQKSSSTAMMVVGPPGAGKTLAIAKLAARGVMNGLRVAVITTDVIRAGGVEQLSAFTNILRVDLQKASSAQSLRAALESARHADQILIDTAGYNPFAPDEMRDLARLITAGDIEPVMVLPAGADADESGEMARVYATLGVRSLLPTRLDIARRLGGLLGAAHHGGLIFADASNTPKVAEGLTSLSPRDLAHLLMPELTRSASLKTNQADLYRRKQNA